MALRRRHVKMPRLRVRVPSSTSNVGPGFDAFGIALDQCLTVTWTAADTTAIERRGPIAESVLSMGRDPVLRGMRRAAILNGSKLPPGQIIVDAPFPPGRGLGASGAGLVAGLRLGNRLTGGRIADATLLQEAIDLEGHPENAAASFLGGAHWSLRSKADQWFHLPVSLHKDLRFLVVIPPFPLETKRSREVLPSSVSFQRASGQAQRPPILLEGLRSLQKDWIRAGVEDDLHVKARLQLLTGAASLLEFADKAGAIAATLSGAGSGLLILTDTADLEKVEARLQARVKRLWGESGLLIRTRVRKQGATLL